MQQVGIGHQPLLGHLHIRGHTVAVTGVDAVVAAQYRIADARHQQGTQARVIAQAVLFMLPFERDDARPAVIQFAVPLRADREQLAQGVGVGDFFVLITRSKTQFIGQRWIQRDVIPGTDVLLGLGYFGFKAVAVTARVAPVAHPAGLATGSGIGRVTQAQGHGARLAGFQVDVDRDHLPHRSTGCGIDAHHFKVATALQVLVKFGNQFRVVRGIRGKRHHALQQGLVKGCIAGKTDFTEKKTRAAFVDQIDIGKTALGVDQQFMLSEFTIEKTVTQGTVLDQALGVFVVALIEHRAGFEIIAGRYLKGLQRSGRAFDAHVDVAQMHRLAGIDAQHQTRRIAGLDLGVDGGLVVTQGLGGFQGLLLRATLKTQKRFLVTIAEAANIAFHVGLEGVVCRFDLDHQLALGTRRKTAEQQDNTTGKSSWERHRRGCYHGLGCS